MNFCKNIASFPDFIEASVIAKEASDGLFDRLLWMTCEPKLVVDMHYGIDNLAQKLQSYYKKAEFVTINLCEEPITFNAPEYAKLPVNLKSIDLLSANFILPWCHDVSSLLKSWQPYLRENAVFLMSTLGPDTLKECRHLFKDSALPSRIDMHDLGDLLVQNGFQDPVLDVDYITLTYKEPARLAHDLVQSGMVDLPVDDVVKAITTLPKENDAWSITYEIVFAHAFCAGEKQEQSADGTVRIPLSQLRRQLLK